MDKIKKIGESEENLSPVATKIPRINVVYDSEEEDTKCHIFYVFLLSLWQKSRRRCGLVGSALAY